MSDTATATNRRPKQKRRTKARSHDRLRQEARALAARLDHTPSQRELCRALHIGAPKARELLEELSRLHLVDASEESETQPQEQPETQPEAVAEAQPDDTQESAPDAPETAPADAPVNAPESTSQTHPETHPEPRPEPEPDAPTDAPATAPEPPAQTHLEPQPETHSQVHSEPVAETRPEVRPQLRGKASAWLAFVAGIGASVAANIAHSFIRPEHAPAGWHWSWGAILFAAFWPVALLLAVEVLTRVTWPNGRWYWLARYAGLTSVAVVAAAVSYSHMSALLASWSDAWVAVHVGPVAVDGLMTMAAAALLGLSKQRQETRS